jgi:predicted small secreted protein
MPIKLIAAILAFAALAACNTMQGAGQDISAAGGAITGEAREAEQGM